MIDRPNSVIVVAIVTVLVSAILAIACGPSDTARSQGGSQFVFESVGSLDGSYYSIARTIDGHLLLGGCGMVSVVDTRNPALPLAVGSFTETEACIQDIAVDGRQAYVAAAEDGLLVLDIADPRVARLVGRYRPEPVRAVAVQGDLAVVAGSNRVHFVDVRDPAHPRQLSTIDATVVRPVLAGDIALLGGTSPVLSVIGIGDPERPIRLGSWNPAPGGWGSDVVVDTERDLAYVGRSVPWQLYIPPPGPTCAPGGPTCTPTPRATRPPSEAWLHVVSLATPAAPAGGRAWSFGGGDLRVSAVAIDPNRELALLGILSDDSLEGWLVALDVAGPGQPGLLAAIELPVQDMATSVGLLYVAAGDQGLRIMLPWAPVSAAFLPSAARRADLRSTAEPNRTRTATTTPTIPATPWPSYFGLDGYVLEGSTSGRGVPNVEITLWIDGAAQMPVLTDADGFYSTPMLELQAADWLAIPSKAGFTFEPPSVAGRHEVWPREHVERASFVAFRGTPTPSATPAR